MTTKIDSKRAQVHSPSLKTSLPSKMKTAAQLFMGVSFWGLSVLAKTEVSPSGYLTNSTIKCDGLAQISVSSIPGTCVGLLSDKSAGMAMPRYAVQAANGVIYVSDMGGWRWGNGTIWAVELFRDENGNITKKVTNLFPSKKLLMPNGLILDPEGRLYVGTPTGIMRFWPQKAGTFQIDAALETFENGFMTSIFRKDEYVSSSTFNKMDEKIKNKHPLIQLAANKDFTEIYFNIGAPSDRCSQGVKTKNDQGFCLQSESALVNAGIWKIKISANSSRQKISTESIARGLRNSMALTVHPDSNNVFQGENSLDLTDETHPFEEINLIQKGKHYGWPYCYSEGLVNPNFEDVVKPVDCKTKYQAPLVFMPAHAAPLALHFYQGQMFPELRNTLLVSWHGYRASGHRVVSYAVDEKGLPINNKPTQIIYGWDGEKDVRPLGAPTGILELSDGSLLVIDDKNSAILRLARGQKQDLGGAAGSGQPAFVQFTEKQKASFKPLVPFLNENCKTCHASIAQAKDVDTLLIALENQGMINRKDPESSRLNQKLVNRQMPPAPLEQKKYDAIYLHLKAFIQSLKEK